MDIDERLRALVRTVELLARLHKDDHDRIRDDHDRIDKLIARAEKDGENIRALARIAETREWRSG